MTPESIVHTLAQDEASNVVWGMPGAMVRAGWLLECCQSLTARNESWDGPARGALRARVRRKRSAP